MNIGARIASARKELDYSQSAFAKQVGVSLSSQKRYEKDERDPGTAYLSAISKAGVNIAFILTGEQQHDLRSELMGAHHAIDVNQAFPGFVKESTATMPEAPSNTLHVPVITHDPHRPQAHRKALWIYSIIEPVVGLRRYTPERSAAIAEALSREYTRLDGKKVRISNSQLYEWLKRYENGLLEGIRPRRRKDIGQRRVLITRKWDKACPLDEGKKRAIAEALAEYVASLWASSALGWKVIQRFANQKLEEYSRRAGWDVPTMELKPACVVTRAFINRWRRGR